MKKHVSVDTGYLVEKITIIKLETGYTIALVLASDPKYPAKWLLHKVE